MKSTLVRRESFGASVCPPNGRPFKINGAGLGLLERFQETGDGHAQPDSRLDVFADAFLETCRALDWTDAPFNWQWHGKAADMSKEALSAPYSVYLYPSIYCNLEQICTKCYVYFSKRRHRSRMLEMDALRPLIDDLADIGVFHITILGGEPLAYPHLESLLGYCDKYPFIVSMSSNGVLLSDAKADMLARYLDRIQISLDGATPDVSELLKGRGTFAPSVRAIERLASRGVGTIVSYVLTRENSSDQQIRQFVELMDGLGANHLSFIQYYPSGDSPDFLRVLDPQESHRIRDTLDSLRQKYDLSISHEDSFSFFSSPSKPKTFRLLETTTRGCECGRTRVSVYPNGDVVPCDFLAKFDDFILGNIFESPVSEIWTNSPVHRHWLARASRAVTVSPCNRCSHRENCAGACQAMAYLYTGSDSNPDPRCPIVNDSATSLEMSALVP